MRTSLENRGISEGLSRYEKVFLHVGLHRTGSTYLQRKVFPLLSLDALIKPDVNSLLQALECDSSLLRTELEKRLPPVCSNRLIISQETLSGRPESNPRGWPESLIGRVKAAVPEGKIILVLRNQWDYLESLYAYRVMSRGLEVRSFSMYLKKHLSGSLIRTLEYDRLVKTYLNSFGKRNVKVLLYEYLASDAALFLGPLCDFLGVPLPRVSRSRQFNVTSRSVSILNAHRAMNAPGYLASSALGHLVGQRKSHDVMRQYSRVKERMVTPLLRDPPNRSKGRMPVESLVREEINRGIGPSNKSLEAILGIELEAFGYHLS